MIAETLNRVLFVFDAEIMSVIAKCSCNWYQNVQYRTADVLTYINFTYTHILFTQMNFHRKI